MFSIYSSSFLTSLLITSVYAHGVVPTIRTDAIQVPAFKLDYYWGLPYGQPIPDNVGWYAENIDNGFLTPADYANPDFICHKAAKPGAISAKVAAGGMVEFEWTEWPASHFGPVFTYVARCPGDCSTVDKTGLKWVKIDEMGADIATQRWAADELIANGSVWATRVPENLAPGNYVFRHEIISLHAALKPNGAQHYPQCFNIEITGSGTDNPLGVLARDLYAADHPGILFNKWAKEKVEAYEIPGPALYRGLLDAASSLVVPNGGEVETAALPASPQPSPQGAAESLSLPTSQVSASTTVSNTPQVEAPAGKSTVKKCRRHARRFNHL